MTEQPSARRDVEILNALGLHLRPAEKFVRLAVTFVSEIIVRCDSARDPEVNGKSMLDLATLGAPQGTRLDLEARGPDAQRAVDALAELVAARFHEDDEGEPQ